MHVLYEISVLRSHFNGKDKFYIVLLSSISVIHDQSCCENLKWKVPEVNNSTVLNCVLVLRSMMEFHTMLI